MISTEYLILNRRPNKQITLICTCARYVVEFINFPNHTKFSREGLLALAEQLQNLANTLEDDPLVTDELAVNVKREVEDMLNGLGAYEIDA